MGTEHSKSYKEIKTLVSTHNIADLDERKFHHHHPLKKKQLKM
jgi:hypothetical protein